MKLEIVKTYLRCRIIEHAFLVTDQEKTEINMRIADTWLARHPRSCYPFPSAEAPGKRTYTFDVPDEEVQILL